MIFDIWVWIFSEDHSSKLKLYNLSMDSKELNDVASEYPEIVEKMENLMKEAHKTPKMDIFKIPVFVFLWRKYILLKKSTFWGKIIKIMCIYMINISIKKLVKFNKTGRG